MDDYFAARVPLHNSILFLAASTLSFKDKLAISRAMMVFLRGVLEDNDENFAHWLKRHGLAGAFPGSGIGRAKFLNVIA